MAKVEKTKKERITIEALIEEYEGMTELDYGQERELMEKLTHKLSYYPVNKAMVKKIGWMFSGIIAMYIEKSMYSMQKYPKRKGWFYYTKQDLYENGHISGKFAAYAKGELIKSELLEVRLKGFPSKEWYKINPLKLLALFAPPTSPIDKINERINAKTKTDFENAIKQVTASDGTLNDINNIHSLYPNVDASIDFIAEDVPNSEANNKTKRNKYKRISKDILPISSKEDIRITSLCDTCVSPSELNEIISYWNTLPNVTKHKLNPNSKTIQSSCKMLSALLQGIPIVSSKNYQPRKELRNFFQIYKIDQVYLRKKWTVDKIKNNLLTAVALRNNHKESGKVSLPVMLWNEFASRDKDGLKTAFSWFYYALALEVTPAEYEKIAEEIASYLKTKNPPLLKWANSLYCFVKEEELDLPYVHYLLQWYLRNRTQAYMPVVRSMDEFIQKYHQIDAHRARQRRTEGYNKLHSDVPIILYDALGNEIH